MNKFLFLFTILILFTGCKNDLFIKVSMSDFKLEATSVVGVAELEISACNDYQNKAKESTDLLRLKRDIPEIIKNSEFQDCFNENFRSIARFTFPVEVIDIGNNNYNSESDIVFIKTASDNNESLLGLYLNDTFRKNVEQYQKEQLLGNNTDLNLYIALKNDTGKNINLILQDSYQIIQQNNKRGKEIMIEKPILRANGSIELKNNQTLAFRLSNVLTDYLFQEGSSVIIWNLN